MEGLEVLKEDVDSDTDGDLPATQPVDDRVLKDVVAYVEVRSKNDNRSGAVNKELRQLGATVVKKFTSDVTHVVFKEGSNRTKTKAQKKGIHLVSVLWVENCKINQEHVSERMYPAVVPKLKGTPLLMTKLKKAKSMQPRDFEEELASSAEKIKRRRKKVNALHPLGSLSTTPSNSPRAVILVQDTQPRSPDDDGFVFTPVRLTIPDTPPSMREKMRKLKLAKEGGTGSITGEDLDDNNDDDDDDDERHLHLKQLQKNLFRSMVFSNNCSSTGQSTAESPANSSVFMSDTDHDHNVENEDPFDHMGKTKHNISIDSESSVNNDIMKIAQNINATLTGQLDKSSSGTCVFGLDSDENLLNSQEIQTVVNIPVKLKLPVEGASEISSSVEGFQSSSNNTVKFSDNSDIVQKPSPKLKKNVKDKVIESDIKQRRRSSRRLSIQQALQELDTSHVLNEQTENNEEENQIQASYSSGKYSSHKSELGDENMLNKQDKRKKTGRNSKGKLNNSIEDRSKRRSKSNSPGVYKAVNEVSGKNESNSTTTTSKAKDGKKTMKKKLLSLTDLTEQHSVLVEPTKFSTEIRPQLEPTKGKRGRKKKSDCVEKVSPSNNDNSEEAADYQKDTNDNGKDNIANVVNNTSKKKNSVEDTRKYGKSAAGRKKRSSVTIATEHRNSKKGKKTLVNETCIEVDTDKTCDNDKTNTGQSPMTKLQDVTTQLNLTKDNGLVCSIRETTLSLSMSTAYTDGNMPSFLISQRRSLDEFNESQRTNKKQKTRDRSVLTSISEQENCRDISSNDSDRSINYNKRHVSQHRKIIRPSIVMTSLHSHEQDVVISVVKRLGGFVITDNVNETTTHVICGESRRTLNVLYGLARGIWLLSKEWVLNSLEAGKWIQEHEFECTDIFPFCKVARLDREKCIDLSRQSLLKGVGRVYVSGRSQPPRQHLVQLLKLCGGQVIGVKERASIYLGSDYHPGITCVKTQWLLDCIMNHKLLPMDSYYLDRPKRESSPVY